MSARLLVCPACGKRVVPEGSTTCPSCAFDGTPGSEVLPVETRAQIGENERKRLEDTIAKGVERGVLRAVGIYLLVTALIGILIAILRANNM